MTLPECDITFGIVTLNNLAFLKILHDNGFDVSATDYDAESSEFLENTKFFLQALKIVFPDIEIEEITQNHPFEEKEYYAKIVFPFYSPDAVNAIDKFSEGIDQYASIYYDEPCAKICDTTGKHTVMVRAYFFGYELANHLINLKKIQEGALDGQHAHCNQEKQPS